METTHHHACYISSNGSSGGQNWPNCGELASWECGCESCKEQSCGDHASCRRWNQQPCRGPTGPSISGTNHSSSCGSSGGKGGLGVAANEFWPRLEAVLLFRVVQGTTWEARHPGTQRKKVSAPNVVQKVKSARGVENAKGKDETRFERVTYRTAAGCSTPELFVLIELVAVGFANAPCKEGATIARTHFSSFHSLTTVNNCSNPSTPTFVPGHCHPINPAA